MVVDYSHHVLTALGMILTSGVSERLYMGMGRVKASQNPGTLVKMRNA